MRKGCGKDAERILKGSRCEKDVDANTDAYADSDDSQ